MSEALAEVFVDVVPSTDRFGPALEQGIRDAAPGAERATSTFADKVGAKFTDLGHRIGGDVGDLVSMVGDGFSKLGDAGGSLGLKFGAVGGASLGLGFALQKLGSDEEQAQTQLRVAITNTGGAWDDYSGRVAEAIAQGHNYGLHAADVERALQTLTQATNDPIKAFQYLGLAEDLAAARHIDLGSAATLVGRVLDGNTKLLRQYGIQTDTTKDKTAALADGLDQLGQRISGQASAAVDNFSGRWDVLRAKVGDFIAQGAGPVGSALSNVGGVASGVAIIMETKLARSMVTAARNVDGLKAKLSAMSGASGSFGKFALAASAAAAGLGLIATAFDKLDQSARGPNTVLAMLENLNKQSSSFRQFAADGTDFATTIGRITDPGLYDRVTNIGSALGDMISFGHGHGVSDADLATQRIKELDAGLTQLVQNGQGQLAAKIVADMSNELRASGKDVDAFTKLLPGYEDAVVGASKSNTGLGDSAKYVKPWLDAERASMQRITDAVDSFNNRFIGAKQAQIDMRNSLRDLVASLKDGKGAFAGTSAAADDAKTKAFAFADSVDKTAQNMRELHKPGTAIIALYQRQHDVLEATLVKMGVARGVAKTYADNLLKIPKNIQTQLRTDVEAIITGVTLSRSAARTLEGIARAKGAAARDFGPPRAAGGNVQAGRTYQVNEARTGQIGNGPETFTPDRDGWITPAGGAGSSVLHYYEAPGRPGERDYSDVLRAFTVHDAIAGMGR